MTTSGMTAGGAATEGGASGAFGAGSANRAAHSRTTRATAASGAWAGWIIFAATMLAMIGILNIAEGVIALIDDERVLITPEQLIAVDLTGWGWTVLIFGVVMLATGVGLFGASTWARVTGIVVVILHAVTQLAWLSAYPVWSLLMLALDVVVLYALTARWQAAAEYLE